MNFQRFHIKLNIQANGQTIRSKPVMVTDGASKTALQFFHSLQNPEQAAATLSLLQSTDGVHFDPVTDSSGNQLSIDLTAGSQSVTISVLGIITLWIAFDIQFHNLSTGSVESCNVLFS
jgi:hypothetical protein